MTLRIGAKKSCSCGEKIIASKSPRVEVTASIVSLEVKNMAADFIIAFKVTLIAQKF